MIFDEAGDARLDELLGQCDETGQQRLGEVASYASLNKEFRALAFGSTDHLKEKLQQDAGLGQRLDKLDLGSVSAAEIAYCEAWGDLAKQHFGSDDSKLVQALNETAGNGGPTG